MVARLFLIEQKRRERFVALALGQKWRIFQPAVHSLNGRDLGGLEGLMLLIRLTWPQPPERASRHRAGTGSQALPLRRGYGRGQHRHYVVPAPW
jgi:hypothetical protein